MCNSFHNKLTPKYTIRVSGVLSLLSSDIYDITLTLYTSVLMREIAHLVPGTDEMPVYRNVNLTGVCFANR